MKLTFFLLKSFIIFSILSKSMASTPNSVSISVISQSATAFTNSTSMLSPFNQPSPLGLSTANTYSVSSLSYPKAPSVLGQPPSWPTLNPPTLPAPPVAVSSGLIAPTLGRPLPVTTTHPGGSYGSSLFTAPLPPSAIPPTSTPLSFSAESLLSNKSKFYILTKTCDFTKIKFYLVQFS
jgi:hypothetical protein